MIGILASFTILFITTNLFVLIRIAFLGVLSVQKCRFLAARTDRKCIFGNLIGTQHDFREKKYR